MTVLVYYMRQDSTAGRTLDRKARCNTDAGTSHRWGVFLSPRSQLSVMTLRVFVQPLCAVPCITICPRTTNPKLWQPYHGLDTQKIMHALTGMSNGALAKSTIAFGKPEPPAREVYFIFIFYFQDLLRLAAIVLEHLPIPGGFLEQKTNTNTYTDMNTHTHTRTQHNTHTHTHTQQVHFGNPNKTRAGQCLSTRQLVILLYSHCRLQTT